MTRLVWLSKKALSPKCESLSKALEKHGFSVDREDGADTPAAYVFCGIESGPVRHAGVPLLWIYDEVSELAHEPAGVGDAISSATDAREVAFRIQLRAKEGVIRKDTLARIAKSETTLKQREEFLSVCAHDLRSPLGLIQSCMGMMLNDKTAALSDFHRELLTRSRRQAVQAITLVNDLLDVMAYEQGLKPQFSLIHLDQLLNEFYKDYRFQAEQKDVRFHYDNPVKDWLVLADADRIRQLLQNIFTNALKFTERGKNIFLNVASFQGRRKNDPAHPMVVISLRDEGKGIPQAEIDKIFDRFSQIKDQSRAEGRGLGLTVAKQISTSHDGNIWVQSVEGTGSTFFVLFPHVISKPAVNPAPKRILIAEPSAARRETYFNQLTSWGYEVIFARDGVEAITLMFHHEPSLVIVSPSLPKLDEVEMVAIVKDHESTSEIPVLFALEESYKTQKRHESMMADRTLKLPFTKESFAATMKEVESSRVVKSRAA